MLIINARDPLDREGSQYDYKNLEEMFGKFGFIVSNLSDDKAWKAEVILPTNIVFANFCLSMTVVRG